MSKPNQSVKQLYLSADTIATIQPDGEVCCQTCGRGKGI